MTTQTTLINLLVDFQEKRWRVGFNIALVLISLLLLLVCGVTDVLLLNGLFFNARLCLIVFILCLLVAGILFFFLKRYTLKRYLKKFIIQYEDLHKKLNEFEELSMIESEAYGKELKRVYSLLKDYSNCFIPQNLINEITLLIKEVDEKGLESRVEQICFERTRQIIDQRLQEIKQNINGE